MNTYINNTNYNRYILEPKQRPTQTRLFSLIAPIPVDNNNSSSLFNFDGYIKIILKLS